MIAQWPKIKASIIHDVGDAYQKIDNEKQIPIEQALDMLKSVLEKQVALSELNGLVGSVMVSLYDSFCGAQERGRQQSAIKDLSTSIEPFLKKVLFIVDPDGYARLHEDQKQPMLIKFLYALNLITRKDYLDESTYESYKGRTDCLGHLCRTYTVRNKVHCAVDWTSVEIAEIEASIILSYLFVVLKYHETIAYGLLEVAFLNDLASEGESTPNGYVQLDACLVDIKHDFCVEVVNTKRLPLHPVVPALDLFRRVRQAVVTGPPGAGKTTVLKLLAGDDARALLQNRSLEFPVPIYADLSKYTESTTLLQVLESASTIPAAEIVALLEKGKIRLYIDGLDEIIDSPHLISGAVREIKCLINSYPEISLALNCRQRNYQDYFGTLPVLHLSPFSDRQIREYVAGMVGSDADEVITFLCSKPGVYALCRVPQFLNIFLSQWRAAGRAAALPGETELVNMLLGEKFKSEKDRFPMEDKKNFLAHFQSKGAEATEAVQDPADAVQKPAVEQKAEPVPVPLPAEPQENREERAAVPDSAEMQREQAEAAPVRLHHMEDFNQLVREYKVFIDTCSLMSDFAEQFFLQKLKPALINNKSQIIVASKVVEELQKHAKSSNLEKKQKAAMGQAILSEYKAADLVSYRGEKNDPFADSVFQYVFQRFLTKYNMALITQDHGLAADIVRLNSLESVKSSYKVRALRINSRSNLSYFPLETNDPIAPYRGTGSSSAGRPRQPQRAPRVADGEAELKQARPQRTAQPRVDKPAREDEKKRWRKFKLGTSPVQDCGIPLAVSKLPQAGEEVKTARFGTVRLVQKISEGGEGAIYLTNNDLVCKVYFPKSLTRMKEEKLQLMLAYPVDVPGICWPLDLARNGSDEFVGYLMPKAYGKPMHNCLFMKPALKNNFPDWNRKELVQTVISVLKLVKSLHDRNIIIGDINPLNFLIKNEKEVFLVDTDSYQIENYPCPVGTVNYTPPERQGKDYKSFLRTFEDESFAVATLAFMMLVPGMPPYSQQGGGTPAENIKNQDFSYPLGEESNKKAPDGTWRFIWSHFPRKVKEGFYNTFRNNERLDTHRWIKLMEFYANELEKGRSNPELFPTSLKLIDAVRTNCSQCGAAYEVSTRHLENLEAQGKTPKCRACIEEDNLDRQYRKYIRNRQQLTNQSRSAADPRRPYSANSTTSGRSNQAPYSGSAATRQPRPAQQAPGYQQPSWQQPRQAPQGQVPPSKQAAPQMPPSQMPAPPKKKKGGWCFITTAAIQARGNLVEKRELQEFRRFRDGWLASRADGPAMIETYYQIAPGIVAAIESSGEARIIYDQLWNAFLSPCLELIRNNEPYRAMTLYRSMVMDLSELLPPKGEQ